MKGERKKLWQRAYMPGYMRRRRAAQRDLADAFIESRLESLGLGGEEVGLRVRLSLDDPAVERQLNRRLYQDWLSEAS